MSWNPEQYLKFSQPRLRPALDLLARVPADDPASVYDLGCGAGNVTALLAQRWPRATLVGVDSSGSMLAQAAKLLPQVRWLQQGLAQWQPAGAVDVIYSNAALHWLPDHAQLLPALVRKLAPGGILAVQMPRNFAAPSHALIATTVRAGPWRSKLEPLLRPAPVAEPAAYHAWLAPLAAGLDIWESEYLQVLSGKDPVKEWTKGSWLTQFLERLDPTEGAAFEADYAQRLRAAYPPLADGSTLLPFRRLFIVLRKA
ncbi:MAG TPA: methyltransferase domain-containing protein [Steroidobacteraceae bacterium]|jgi:trans-aconitate 2-methyltransferase